MPRVLATTTMVVVLMLMLKCIAHESTTTHAAEQHQGAGIVIVEAGQSSGDHNTIHAGTACGDQTMATMRMSVTPTQSRDMYLRSVTMTIAPNVELMREALGECALFFGPHLVGRVATPRISTSTVAYEYVITLNDERVPSGMAFAPRISCEVGERARAAPTNIVTTLSVAIIGVEAVGAEGDRLAVLSGSLPRQLATVQVQ